MLGKRPRASMRRTSSVSLIGSNVTTTTSGENSPVPAHPKEKLKSMNSSPCPSSVICVSAAAVPCQVIGFHPKVDVASSRIEDGPDHSLLPVGRRSRGANGSSGSPRSGLNDLFSACRSWDRNDGGGVGLGIVASLGDGVNQGSPGAPNELADNVLQGGPLYSVGNPTPANPVNGGVSGSSHGFPQTPSLFSPVRGSPPIPIQVLPSPLRPSDYNCQAQNVHPNCHQAPSAFAPGALCPALATESMFMGGGSNTIGGSSYRDGGVTGSRPAYVVSTVVWSKANGYAASGIGSYGMSWGHQQTDMEIDCTDGHSLAASPIALGNLGACGNFGGGNPFVSPTGGFGPNFLKACYSCKKKFGVGIDIFIYRGDRGFCSAECRQQHILQNERMEKCASAAIKNSLPDGRRGAQRGGGVVSAGTATAA